MQNIIWKREEEREEVTGVNKQRRKNLPTVHLLPAKTHNQIKTFYYNFDQL